MNFESRVVVRAEILLQGRSFHFFNSHFYTNITSSSPQSQVQQAGEVANYVAQTTALKSAPAAVVCDCNSPENGPVRARFSELGYTDSWSATQSGKAGNTGGQDINSTQSTASSRIDYIFTKGMAAKESAVFPAGPATGSGGPAWPSDHLGVTAGPF
ncbi:MAG: hypothetical protein EBR09_11610 [Proteobacteria bacterium]|nr:hypothetical protein [Pseudomonadota bacterium]